MSEKEPFIVFGAPIISDEEISSVVTTMKSGWVGPGPRVREFEEKFAAYRGVNQAVAVSSCTAALHLSILCLDLNPGDELITTPLTFAATVNAIVHSGATPVLADVDPETLNIDPNKIREKITSRTKAIVIVHFAGRPCEMDKIMEIAKQNNLSVIEDCAHAIETEHHGRKAGTIGDFGCFSFYVTKNITTVEGGMVFAKKAENLDRVKAMAFHGMDKNAWRRYSDSGYQHYYISSLGFKNNLTDLQASIGLQQLKQVEKWWGRRKQIWDYYCSELANLNLTLPPEIEPNTRHGYHLFTVLINPKKSSLERDEVLKQLTAKGIGTGVHYLSIPEHPYYQQAFGWRPEQYPHAQRIGRETLSIPLSAKLSDSDVERICAAVSDVLG